MYFHKNIYMYTYICNMHSPLCGSKKTDDRCNTDPRFLLAELSKDPGVEGICSLPYWPFQAVESMWLDFFAKKNRMFFLQKSSEELQWYKSLFVVDMCCLSQFFGGEGGVDRVDKEKDLFLIWVGAICWYRLRRAVWATNNGSLLIWGPC